MRSAPLVKLDRDTCVVIDELIDMFLGRYEPHEISESMWEEEMYPISIWMTLEPVVHLAFAAGKEYYQYLHNNVNGNNQPEDDSTSQTSEDVCFMESKLSKATTPKVDKAKSGAIKKSQSTCSSPLLNNARREEKPSDMPESIEIATSSISGKGDQVITGHRSQFTMPGSTSTQKFGIFSLVQTLSLKENQQTALSENLLPYLVCLSWHLKCTEREKLRTCLANFDDVPLPSLKVAAKSVLAIVYGLDMVFNL